MDDESKSSPNLVNSNDTGYGTVSPESATADHENAEEVPGRELSATPNDTREFIYIKSITEGSKNTPMRKSSDFFSRQTVTSTDHTSTYISSRRTSLTISRDRILSYPLSDDNLKGKALDSESLNAEWLGAHKSNKDRPHDQRSLASNVGQVQHSIQVSNPIRSMLESMHKSPDYNERLKEFIFMANINNHWSEIDGFKACDNSMIMRFYKLANLVIRSGEECSYCLLCCKQKGDHAVDSHIFPKCLLKTFSEIHNALESLFIFDPSSPAKMHSARTFSLPLLCNECDRSTSNEECKLRNLYLYLMDPEKKAIEIEIEKPAWLWYVWIALMFRGMLLMNFFELISMGIFESFQNYFLKFRQYLLGVSLVRNTANINQEDRKKAIEKVMCEIPACIKDNFSLHFLPIGSCQKFVPNITQLFEFTLRNPQHTYLVHDSRNIFLCTNFDCFYNVLKLSHCKDIPIDAGKLNLSEPFILLSSQMRKILFPPYLVEVKLRQTQFFQTVALDYSESMGNAKAVIERLPKSTSEPSFKWLGAESGIDQKSQREKFPSKIKDKETENNMICRARKESPLTESGQVKDPENLEKKVQDLEKKSHSDTNEMRELKKKVRTLEILEKELSKKDKCIDKQVKLIKKLQQENSELNAKLVLQYGEEQPAMQVSDIEEDSSVFADQELVST